MQAAARGEVTQLLLAWRGGDQEALNRLVPLVYTEPQQLAHGRLLAHPLEHSLQIELRFFGGLSVEETAESLSVSRDTALRDWRMARAWLKSELSKAAPYG